MDALVAVEGKNHLAITSRLELVLARIPLADVQVVIDFAVYGKYLFMVGREKGLLSALGVDNGQTLVGKDSGPPAIDSAPVGSAVTYFLCHGKCLVAERFGLFLDIEYADYSTHKFVSF